MIKTLNGKLSLINIIIIIAMTLLGLISVRNLISISNDINGLITNNYKSIQATEKMKVALSEQQYAMFNYLSDNKYDAIEIYSKYSGLFLDNYYFEKSNITENGEMEHVNSVYTSYLEYNQKFFSLTELVQSNQKDAAYNFFFNEVKVTYDEILVNLDKITTLNENMMINSKTRVEDKTNSIINITILLIIVSTLISFFLSKHLLKKILNPLNNIIDAIKDIKTNSTYKQLKVTTGDELGELTTQFNLMAKRIESFEKSTLGKILKERNNSNSILKSIDSPMVVIDNDYKVTMINHNFIETFDISDDKLEGRYLTHLVNDRSFFSIIYDITLNNCQGDFLNIITLKNEHGDVHYYNISIKEIKEETSQVGYVILLKDVTHLKEVEQISKDFFATISHEFKTPLTSIMIGTGLLESSKLGNLSEDQRKILTAIKEDGERLNLLVSNMLLLSKIESSNEIYKKEYHSIEDLVKTSVSSNKGIADYSGIILEYHVESNVNPLSCDGEKLVWVMNNLTINAIRHCKYGDLISIRGFIKDDKLNITVTDTGVGILKDNTERIFDKYTQLTNKDIKNNSGLGLWICKDIINAHNGEISCESDLGEGATFTITIPYN
ncbi:MAG: ATP-binding protein [Clostridium sp.]|uniref:ATP-binding protein n=1 Tax=Clostridium sp. TaxID=1506 RepID=UPI00304DB941